MIALRFAAATLVFAIGIPSLDASLAENWSVVVADNAFVDRQATTQPLSTGAVVTMGDHLRTGAGGTLVLSRGDDLVTMAETSAIVVVDPQPNGTTLIEQPYGHVEYHVTKEKVPHFQVDAPLLATVVKGTTFSVDASLSKSSVTVKEGRVVAKNRRTGASNSVGAGERGAVESGGRGVDVASAPSNSSAAAASSNASSVSGSGDGASGSNGASSGGKGGPGGGKDKAGGDSGGGKDKGKDKASGNAGSGKDKSGESGGGKSGGNGKGKNK
jgi:hypothetical protein